MINFKFVDCVSSSRDLSWLYARVSFILISIYKEMFEKISEILLTLEMF